MKLILPKGTPWLASQTGEYNFYYPDRKRLYETQVPIEVTRLSWVTCEDLVPVQVVELSEYTPCAVLWVKEVHITNTL
jgi:hypothetical protein